MGDTYNVFISWSGERSEKVATALYDWLPMVLQTAKPWMSKEDIAKGSRALEEIGKALDAMSVGILCLTPENAAKPWIHFEAGALSKVMGDKSRVCPYLFGGLHGEQLGLPLGIFQATKAEKEETRKMVLAINRALGGLVAGDGVNTWFEREWPNLEKRLEVIPPAKVAAAPQADEKKMLTEVLGLAQAETNSSAKIMEELRGLRELLTRVVAAQRPPMSGTQVSLFDPNVTLFEPADAFESFQRTYRAFLAGKEKTKEKAELTELLEKVRALEEKTRKLADDKKKADDKAK
jgi:hypothetical protein